MNERIEIEDSNNLLRAIDPEYIINGIISELAFERPGPGISVLIAEHAEPQDFCVFQRMHGWMCAKGKVSEVRSISSQDQSFKVVLTVEHKPSWHLAHSHIEGYLNGKKADKNGWITLAELGIRERVADAFKLDENVIIRPCKE